MFNKFNNKLVVNYPLLWNTKVFSIISVMLVFHFLFYLFGFFSVNNIRYLISHRNYERILDDTGVYTFAVLLMIVVIIIWLLFYLRNNAFKNFYPVSKSYLAKEFFILWLIFFITITLFHSYAYGRHVHVLILTKDCNPAKEAEIINQAHCFLPVDIEKFDKQNCCDSLNARAEAMSKIVHPLHDSCENYFGNTVYPYDTDYSNSEVQPEPYSEVIPIVKAYSYLYYCQDPVFIGDTVYNKYDYHAIAKNWLKNRNTDSIRRILLQYAGIMDRYKLKYNMDVDSLVSWCFLDSIHTVKKQLSSISLYADDSNEEFSPNNIAYKHSGEFNSTGSVIENVERERQKNFFNLSEWLIYFYVSLSLSIVLFMFRITRLKPWIAAIIGVGIWSILIALAAQAGKHSIPYLICSLILLFGVLSYRFIKNKYKKLLAGILLNWLAFGFLLFIPLIFSIIEDNTGEIRQCIGQIWVVTRPQHPINIWINNNWDTINSINILSAACVMVFLLIPLAYRWQSNPSE